MTTTKYGIAIIGAGMIGKKHAQVINSLKRAHLVAVFDHLWDNARQFAEHFHCEAYDDLEIMLMRNDIQVVSICSPSGLHGQHALQCAAAHKHVISEKPMEIQWHSAQQMIAVCRRNHVKLGIISQHRFHPDIVKVKTLINQGQLGEIISGNASVNWYRTQDYYDSASWRGSKQWDGGGALMNQGIHTVDLLQYLAGPISQVYAQCRTAGHERIEVEDVAAVTLHYENGAVGTLFATTCAYPGLHTRIELIGTKGTVVIINNELQAVHLANALDISMVSSSTQSGLLGLLNPQDSVGDTHFDQYEDFLDAVDQDREPAINGEEGSKALAIILASYWSATESRIVRIHELNG